MSLMSEPLSASGDLENCPLIIYEMDQVLQSIKEITHVMKDIQRSGDAGLHG